MCRHIVTARAGETLEVQDNASISVMDVIRDAEFDTLLARCGGCCSCATCYGRLDSTFADARVPMGVDEDDVLDSSDDHQPNSRLSFQRRFTDALDGLCVTTLASDRSATAIHVKDSI